MEGRGMGEVYSMSSSVPYNLLPLYLGGNVRMGRLRVWRRQATLAYSSQQVRGEWPVARRDSGTLPRELQGQTCYFLALFCRAVT